jgi:hypothetical protein
LELENFVGVEAEGGEDALDFGVLWEGGLGGCGIGRGAVRRVVGCGREWEGTCLVEFFASGFELGGDVVVGWHLGCCVR